MIGDLTGYEYEDLKYFMPMPMPMPICLRVHSPVILYNSCYDNSGISHQRCTYCMKNDSRYHR